jgi:hypothetical protein
MALIPRREKTRVEEMIESGFVDPEPPRRYLGVSIIGRTCPRQIWYMFRWYLLQERITPRQKRLFSRGHREEPIIHADLKKIGIKVISKQEGSTTAEGHISGHNDGVLINVPDAPKTKHLNEIKTSKHSIFIKLAKIFDTKAENQTCIELWSLTYYVQAIVYMYMFKLKRCLYIVVNKDNDERFYERFKADTKTAKYYLQRGVDIINSDIPPEKINPASHYKCGPKWCRFNLICHHKGKPSKTCRSCRYSEPVKKGKWYCNKNKKNISYKKQLKACKKYAIIKSN